MLSVVGAYQALHGGGGGSHVAITYEALNLTKQGPPPHNMLKRVHYETRKVGKRTVGMLLECFLVFI